MTMPSFAVLVDVESLNRSAHGQVSGIVYVEIDGIPFPERQWSDSIIVVLASWLEALNNLATGISPRTSLRFMDGPFRIDVQGGGDCVHVSAVDGRRGETLVNETDEDLAAMRTATRMAAAQVLQGCSQKTWWSPDIDRLVHLSNQAAT